MAALLLLTLQLLALIAAVQLSNARADRRVRVYRAHGEVDRLEALMRSVVRRWTARYPHAPFRLVHRAAPAFERRVYDRVGARLNRFAALGVK